MRKGAALIIENKLLRMMHRITESIPPALTLCNTNASHGIYNITITTLKSIYTWGPSLRIVLVIYGSCCFNYCQNHSYSEM